MFEILQSVKTCYDLAGTISKPDLVAKLDNLQREVVSLLESNVASLQSRHDLQAEKAELEHAIRDLEAKLAFKKDYRLFRPLPGIFVYEPRQRRENVPNHWLCANCAEEGHKVYLQLEQTTPDGNIFKCNRCELLIKVRGHMP